MRKFDDTNTDTETPSHQRPPFADPLPGAVDPTAPGAPHEPAGTDFTQSREGDAREPAEPAEPPYGLDVETD